MREGWKSYKLGDVVEIKYGKDHKKLGDGSYPLYGSGGIMRYVDSYLYDKESVLIPRKGTLSNLFYLSEPFSTVDTMFWTKINNLIVIPRFLYFLLKTYDLASLDEGAAIPSLTTKALNVVRINLPPLEIQKKIATILSAYDDLIENNLKRIKILEEMAQQTYEEWFVRMRFPGYESATIDTETGLPEVWGKVKLGDWIKTSSGGTPSKKLEDKYYLGGEIPWVRTGELKNFILIDSEIKITALGLKNSSAKIFPKGTVLLAMYGNTIGETSYCAFETSTNQACCGFLVEKTAYSYFLHQYLLFNKEYILSFRMGAAQENISQSIIQAIELTKPTDELLNSFGEEMMTRYDLIITLLNQNKRLREARDILLPRLMNGMIEV